MEGQITASANGNVTINFDKDGYAKYLEWVAGTRERNIAALIKEMGDKVPGRRQTLVMRRVKAKEVAPDEDIAAYGQIHKLRRPITDEKKKVIVTENEIKAYKVLDPEFKESPMLEAIIEKVQEMVASGELPEEGDNMEDADTETRDKAAA